MTKPPSKTVESALRSLCNDIEHYLYVFREATTSDEEREIFDNGMKVVNRIIEHAMAKRGITPKNLTHNKPR